jgi:hypothetical protein
MDDNEEELVDVNNIENSESVESLDSDESLNEEGEDNTPAKKNKSNWKKMKQELKALKAENAALKSNSDDSDDDSDDDDDTDEPVSTRYAPIELEVKFLKNPGAQEYEAEIMENFRKYPDMKFEDAFNLAKASKPVSETKRNLSFKSSSKPKDITNLSQEEALKLDDPKAYLEWARKTGNIKE